MRITWKTFGATASAALALGASAQQAPVVIELRAQVVVAGSHVTLGDIAYMRTTDLAAIQRLVTLPIGRAPRADSEVIVQREVIARWVRAQTWLRSDQIEWRGAQETSVTSKSQETARVGADQAERAAPRDVPGNRASRLPPAVARGDRVEVHMKNGDIDLEVSGEALESGALGQTVKIRWGKSSASVSGRVIAPGRVEALL